MLLNAPFCFESPRIIRSGSNTQRPLISVLHLPWPMTKLCDNRSNPTRLMRRRQSMRATLDSPVMSRRAGFSNFRVSIRNLSPEGCKIEFIDRPKVNEHVWVKLEGLEAIEAIVCWVGAHEAGLRFGRPLHPAVFDLLVHKLQ